MIKICQILHFFLYFKWQADDNTTLLKQEIGKTKIMLPEVF